MPVRGDHKRVLIYSHDSFGLGHLRRCRAIAHALVEADPAISVLILSGSPIIGSFDFGPRVDFVRVPGVIKLHNGEYVSLNLPIDIEETLALVRRRGAAVILGLRDVMDDPGALRSEWQRKHAIPALAEYYDEIWVYGLPQICNPLAGLALPEGVHRRIAYTGYLRRRVDDPVPGPDPCQFRDNEFLLVTPGGGGDGGELIDLVLRAYEHDPLLPLPALLVFGPFMPPEQQAAFADRA